MIMCTILAYFHGWRGWRGSSIVVNVKLLLNETSGHVQGQQNQMTI